MANKTATTTPERIGRLGQRRQVVIPREIIENLRMRTGDFLAITQKADTVIIKAKRIVVADDVLTSKEAEMVRRGGAALQRGESKTWRGGKNAAGRGATQTRRIKALARREKCVGALRFPGSRVEGTVPEARR